MWLGIHSLCPWVSIIPTLCHGNQTSLLILLKVSQGTNIIPRWELPALLSRAVPEEHVTLTSHTMTHYTLVLLATVKGAYVLKVFQSGAELVLSRFIICVPFLSYT